MAYDFFTIEMLPACHGDALLVEYGKARTRRLMIDGGPLQAWPDVERRLAKLPDGDKRVELLVITHVDTDHVEGVIRLMAVPMLKWPIAPREIWFNGWRHIEEARDLGGREGELISALIHRRAGELWNTAFQRKAVRTGVLPGDRVELADGMKLTLVSPDANALAKLLEDWKESAGNWEIAPGDLEAAWANLVAAKKFHPDSQLTLGPGDLTGKLRALLKGRDSGAPNGSSIAFIGEYADKTCLFLGDAHMNVVCASLRRLGATPQAPLRLDALKMSHHGSKNNITPELLELIDAKHYLFSSSGERFSHPNSEAVEAVIRGSRRKPTLWFNYRSSFNKRWEAASKRPGAKFATRYPKAGEAGIVVKL